MASSDNFGVEHKKALKAVEWMNSYAKLKNKKFEVKLKGYVLETLRFGSFDVISWTGEWSFARDIIVRASSKLNMKVIESGYHQKGSTLYGLLRISKEYGKVYSDGNLIGNVVFGSKSNRWYIKSEEPC